MQFQTRCNGSSTPLTTHGCDGKFYQKNRQKFFDQISSSLQQKEETISTVFCSQSRKYWSNCSSEFYSEINWNCTGRSQYIFISCKGSQEGNSTLHPTRMCCQVSFKKENSSLTASCLEIFGARNVSSMQTNNIKKWHCEWEWYALNISQQTFGPGDKRMLGTYYRYTGRRNKTHLQTCHSTEKITQTTRTTSLPPVTQSSTASTFPSSNRRNASSTIIGKVTTLGKNLTEFVHYESWNCSAEMIAELLPKIEDRVHSFLREILDSQAVELPSFFSRIIELHGVIATSVNKTLKVPSTAGAGQSHGLLVLPPGSIDIKNERLAIITVVLKFASLCNDKEGLALGSLPEKRSSVLKSPIVSVLGMTNKSNVHTLQKNATLRFRIKRDNQSSVGCRFLRNSSGSKPFWSDKGMTFKDNYEKNFTSCLTNHLTSFAVLINYNDDQSQSKLTEEEFKALDLITKIGCGFAISCLLGVIVTFSCVRTLSAMRYRIHIHLCVALVAAQLIFVTGIDATGIKEVCIAVAVMLHYFFTASFVWMCIEAVHMFFKIVSVFNIQRIRMRHYVALGWGVPAVIVAVSATVYNEGYGTSKFCWLSLEGDFIWAFLTPVVVIVLINAFVLVAITAVRISLKDNPLTPHENRKFNAALKTVVVLFPLLGLSWFFGFMWVLTSSRPFLYAFVILSSLQGVFILLFHCIGNREVRSSIKQIKDRHSLESSIRHEQKFREGQRNDKSSNGANYAESRVLLTKVSGLKKSKEQVEKATDV
ncbi:putative G-protein coupled receptor 133 [Stylophora pistillata]|uniref:Putative G-protein coupled receptor 133 n=3 Tax=Stylophora pistillata TaxID=50429 RepID=A0A2B4S306_STYPI|nr:putative G-protein coupled receptor 133 [Stylophora pistillata]